MRTGPTAWATDLAAAGLAGTDDQGRIVDFHSLRQTFITRLSVAKVHLRVAMALARHSRLELTKRTYTDTRLLDLRGAVEGLPSLGGAGAEERNGARDRSA